MAAVDRVGEESQEEYGYNGQFSDRISLDRSILDYRHKKHVHLQSWFLALAWRCSPWQGCMVQLCGCGGLRALTAPPTGNSDCLQLPAQRLSAVAQCTSRTDCHSMSPLEYPTCLADPACISVLGLFDLWAVGTYSKPLNHFFSFAESNRNDSFPPYSASFYNTCFITLQRFLSFLTEEALF